MIYEDDDNFIPEPQVYQKRFPDGSRIQISEDQPECDCPKHQRIKLWQAEEVESLMTTQEWSTDQAIQYIEANYGKA
jgi:hypothetical protein